MSKKIITHIKKSLALFDNLLVERCKEVSSNVIRDTYLFTEHDMTDLEKWRLLERIINLSQAEGVSLTIIERVCRNKVKKGLHPLSVISEKLFMLYLDEVIWEDQENDFRFLKPNPEDY